MYNKLGIGNFGRRVELRSPLPVVEATKKGAVLGKTAGNGGRKEKAGGRLSYDIYVFRQFTYSRKKYVLFIRASRGLYTRCKSTALLRRKIRELGPSTIKKTYFGSTAVTITFLYRRNKVTSFY